MALSDIVNVTISTSATTVDRAGFGIPLVLAADCPAGFTERVRSYSDMTGVVADFAATTATYKQIAKIFSQNPKPTTVMVGRLALKPTQSFRLTPTSANSTLFRVNLRTGTATADSTADYTSDSSSSVAEITAGLKTAIDALSLAVTTTDNSTSLDITVNTAGAFLTLDTLGSIGTLKVEQRHADPGVATDLDAIKVENDSWYAIQNPFNSRAMGLAIAAWAETNEKLYIAQSQDTDIANVAAATDAAAGTPTFAAQAKLSSYYRTTVFFGQRTDDFEDAGLLGRLLPLDPGSETWSLKTLAGVSVRSLTATQKTNILAKNAMLYETNAGVNVTREGKTAAGEWIDVIRFRDWLKVNMQADVFEALVNAPGKIPYTDAGIAIIEGVVRARLAAGVAVGGLAADPAPKVTVPRASAISSSVKATRVLPNVKADAILAGAIHAVTINISITA